MNALHHTLLVAATSLVILGSPGTAPLATSTPFTIGWTAPGDDSMIGRATVYDLRYSNLPLTAANFGLATKLAGLPAPAVAGTPQSFVVSGLPDSLMLYLGLKTGDEAGNWSALSNVVKRPGQVATVGESALAFSFSSPWPNPARVSTRWAFSMAQTARVQVDVFDITGRHVQTIARGERGAGRGELSWDLRDEQGRPVGSGVYLVKARLGVTEWTKRLVVMR